MKTPLAFVCMRKRKEHKKYINKCGREEYEYCAAYHGLTFGVKEDCIKVFHPETDDLDDLYTETQFRDAPIICSGGLLNADNDSENIKQLIKASRKWIQDRRFVIAECLSHQVIGLDHGLEIENTNPFNTNEELLFGSELDTLTKEGKASPYFAPFADRGEYRFGASHYQYLKNTKPNNGVVLAQGSYNSANAIAYYSGNLKTADNNFLSVQNHYEMDYAAAMEFLEKNWIDLPGIVNIEEVVRDKVKLLQNDGENFAKYQMRRISWAPKQVKYF